MGAISPAIFKLRVKMGKSLIEKMPMCEKKCHNQGAQP